MDLTGQPEPVNVHDFPDPERSKAIPYGVYDSAANSGFVSVGMTHDTAAFSGQAIRLWWSELGSERYPNAQRRLMTGDEAAPPWPSQSIMEMGTATTGERAQPDDLGLSFSAGNQQMEQDRASAV